MVFHVSFSFLDQSEYSYAYEHTLLGTSPPKRALSARNPPTAVLDESDGTYVTPDESVVNEFMEDIQEKRTVVSHEVADEQAVAGFMDSLKRKQTLNGMLCGEFHSYFMPLWPTVTLLAQLVQ